MVRFTIDIHEFERKDIIINEVKELIQELEKRIGSVLPLSEIKSFVLRQSKNAITKEILQNVIIFLIWNKELYEINDGYVVRVI